MSSASAQDPKDVRIPAYLKSDDKHIVFGIDGADMHNDVARAELHFQTVRTTGSEVVQVGTGAAVTMPPGVDTAWAAAIAPNPANTLRAGATVNCTGAAIWGSDGSAPGLVDLSITVKVFYPGDNIVSGGETFSSSTILNGSAVTAGDITTWGTSFVITNNNPCLVEVTVARSGSTDSYAGTMYFSNVKLKTS